MKRYAKMTTEKLWYERAMCGVRMEDMLYRAHKNNTLVNIRQIKRLRRKRGMIDIELEKRDAL